MSTKESSINIYKERVFPVLFMLIVTAVFIAMVSGIYLATRENVLRNERLYLKRAVLFAADIRVPETNLEIEDLYNRSISEKVDQDGQIQYYEVTRGGSGIQGYVLPAVGPGLWGEIEAVVGYSVDLTELTGIDFTKQNETPGLGARITEAWFRTQFRGKTGPFTRVPEGTEGEGTQEFDAITGATITSTAIQNILNKQLDAAARIVGRE